MEKLSPPRQKIFREINVLVTSLVKTLLSRNFCHDASAVTTFTKFCISSLQYCKSYSGLVSRNIYRWGVNLCFFFTAAAFDRNDLDKIVTVDLPAFSGYNVFLSDLITLRLDFLTLSFQSKIVINYFVLFMFILLR